MVLIAHPPPEVLLDELKRALRHGCRASRLLRYAPELIEMLIPADDVPVAERATIAEAALRRAAASYGSTWAEVTFCLLGLASGTHGALLKDRRRQASDILNLPVETFRRHYENDLLWDLAVALNEGAHS